jgi:hypothetical protein
MLLRNLGVIAFIGATAATAAYFAQRPTIARGDILAQDLVDSNPTIKALDCDKRVPIGVAGANFNCSVEFKNGDRAQYLFAMDRAGSITIAEEGEKHYAPVIKKTGDPWGD